MTHARMAPARLLAAAAVAVGSLAIASPATSLSDPEAELHSLQHVRATGSVHSGDGAFRRGCQSHGYRYRVRPGGSDWSLELFLIDAGGKQVSDRLRVEGARPEARARQLRLLLAVDAAREVHGAVPADLGRRRGTTRSGWNRARSGCAADLRLAQPPVTR